MPVNPSNTEKIIFIQSFSYQYDWFFIREQGLEKLIPGKPQMLTYSTEDHL